MDLKQEKKEPESAVVFFMYDGSVSVEGDLET